MKPCPNLSPRRRLARVRALALSLCLACATVAIAADPRAARMYEDALQRFDKKDFRGAIVQLKNAIQIDRRNLSVQVLLGRALMANGELAAAEAAFEEALRLGVNPAEVIVPLAESLALQGKPDLLLSQERFAHAALPTETKTRLLLTKAAAASDTGNTREALKLLEEARASEPGGARSWAAEVPIRVRARQLKEARAAADKALALDPKLPEASYQLASVIHVGGDLKAAVAQYTRTLELKADHVDALVARGGIYFDLGQLKEAEADVQAARRVDAADPRSAYLAALLAERAGRNDEMRKQLDEVTNLLDVFPIEFLRYRPQALMLGGMSHYAMGRLEKAQPYLETLLRHDPNSPVSKLLAQIYIKQKNNAKAIEALETYLRNRPGDRHATTLLASALMAQGRHARATQLLQEALKQGEEPSMRAVLGMGLVGSGRYADAAAELEAVLKRDPGQLQAGVTLAGLYLASGQAGKAAAVAEGLSQRNPSNAGLANLLGTAQAGKGDAAAARASFDRAVKLAPGFNEPVINLARLDIDERKYEMAQKRLDVVLGRDPKNVDASIELARMAAARGKLDEAQRFLERADDNSGPDIRAGLQLVDFALAGNKLELARAAVKRLQGKSPEALAVLLALARMQLAGADRAGAKSTLSRASTVANIDPAALTQIASLQVQAGDVAGAAYGLGKALGNRPNHLQARALLANVEILQGQPAKAEQIARGIVASEPKLGLGHALLADVALARSQPQAAIESLRRAHQIDNNSASLLRLFGVLEGRDRPAAIALANQWLQARPTDVAVRRALADAQARGGQMAAARASYEEALKATPQDAELLNNLAYVLVELRDPAALRTAERALALRPDAPHIIGTTGWAAFHAGAHDRALQLLRDARLRDPNNPDARFFLATALAQKGRASEAREELTAAAAAARSGRPYANQRAAEQLLQTLR